MFMHNYNNYVVYQLLPNTQPNIACIGCNSTNKWPLPQL